MIAILLIGAILRLYKIADYMTFLGDEGRDVIVVRRFLVDFDLMLVGPGTSIGNMYLGPIYYYLMAPALLLAGFDPVGPAVMIALLGVGTIYFVWHVSREWFGKVAALVSAILYATAPVVIIYSRSSWNPNIMPFFALLVIYSIWKFWHERKYQWLIATAASFAFVLQSHYLGLLLGPVIGFFWLLSYFKAKGSKNTKYLIRYTAYAAVLFTLLMSPLVIFDARHNWMNFSAMKEFFLQRQTTVSARPWTAIPKLPEIVNEASSRIAGGTDGAIGKYISLTLLLGLVVSLFKTKEIKKLVRFKINDKRFAAYFLITIWLTFAFIGLGVYKQEIYDHYYGFIFAAPFILIGAFSQVFIEKHKA
ncbi:glycosyltransferase family 39 protein [bacterium]|nr:glycosyltransferase family 39 protein [bacterium]